MTDEIEAGGDPVRPRLADRDPDELRALVRDVVPDEVLCPPSADVPEDWPEGLAPPKSPPTVEVDELEPVALAELVIAHADRARLVELIQPAIDAGVPVNLDVLTDVHDAARGAMVEREREAATAAAVREANAAAPSAEEIEAFYSLGADVG